MLIYDLVHTFHQSLYDVEETSYDLVKYMVKIHNDREIEKQLAKAKEVASGMNNGR